ncbi:MAG: hypothetical protein OXC30_00280 [Alphaproteobacteria bacterium]|nr:hypothetical protein [Alphaproteobacteria bacterium]
MHILILFFLSCYIFSATLPTPDDRAEKETLPDKSAQKETRLLLYTLEDCQDQPELLEPKHENFEDCLLQQTYDQLKRPNYPMLSEGVTKDDTSYLILREDRMRNAADSMHYKILAGLCHAHTKAMQAESLTDDGIYHRIMAEKHSDKKVVERTYSAYTAEKKDKSAYTDAVAPTRPVLHIFHLLEKDNVPLCDNLLMLFDFLHQNNVSIKLHAAVAGPHATTCLNQIQTKAPFVHICSITSKYKIFCNKADWSLIFNTYEAIIRGKVDLSRTFESPAEVIHDQILENATTNNPTFADQIPRYIHEAYRGFQYATDHFLFLSRFTKRYMLKLAAAFADDNYQGEPTDTTRFWTHIGVHADTRFLLMSPNPERNPVIQKAFSDINKALASIPKHIITQKKHSLPEDMEVYLGAITAMTEGYPFIMVSHKTHYTKDMLLKKEKESSANITRLVAKAKKHGYTLIITAKQQYAHSPFSHRPFIITGEVHDIAPVIGSFLAVPQIQDLLRRTPLWSW